MWKVAALFTSALAFDADLTTAKAQAVIDGNKINIKAHGFKVNEVVWFVNGGTAFGEIKSKTFYKVRSVTGTDQFTVQELGNTAGTNPLTDATAITHSTEATNNVCGTKAYFVGTGADIGTAPYSVAKKQFVATGRWDTNGFTAANHNFADGDKVVIISPGTRIASGNNGVVPMGGAAMGAAPNANMKVYCTATRTGDAADAVCTYPEADYKELFVVNSATNTFKVALTSGGTALGLTLATANDASDKDLVVASPSRGTKKYVCTAVDTNAKCVAADSAKHLYNSSTKKCVAGSHDNCKAIDSTKPEWDATKKECKAKASSSASRILTSASIVAFFGLIA